MLWTLGDSKLAIHHPNEIHMYSVTREQILLLSEKFKSEGNTYYPQVFSITITCLINCIMSFNDVTSVIFIGNTIVFVITLIFGAILFYIFKSKENNNKLLLDEILSQPLQTAKNKVEADVNGWTNKT